MKQDYTGKDVNESTSEKESRQPDVLKNQDGYEWKTCNVTTGPDFIPCLDNIGAPRKIHTTQRTPLPCRIPYMPCLSSSRIQDPNQVA